MTSCPSKRNVTRQFPDTLTDHSPFRFPFSGCKSYPGRSMAAGSLATFSSVKISRSLSTCCAWTPFRSSFSKRRFNPLCVNLRITLLTVTCNVSGVNEGSLAVPRAHAINAQSQPPRHRPPVRRLRLAFRRRAFVSVGAQRGSAGTGLPTPARSATTATMMTETAALRIVWMREPVFRYFQSPP